MRTAIGFIVAIAVIIGGGMAAWGFYEQQTSPPREVPEAYRALVIASAKRCPQVPVTVLAAQLAVESSWNPRAVSGAGAQGIAQFMPSTWKDYGIDGNRDGTASVWDPADAIPASAELNCVNWDLVAKVPGDRLANTLAAYNAGFAAVRKYDGIPPFPETQKYVVKVLELSKEIQVSPAAR